MINRLQCAQKEAVDTLLNTVLPQERMLHAVIRALDINVSNVHTLLLQSKADRLSQRKCLFSWPLQPLKSTLTARQGTRSRKEGLQPFIHHQRHEFKKRLVNTEAAV